MQTEYLNRLPFDVRALVEQIERESGVNIMVGVDASRVRGWPNQPDPLESATLADPRSNATMKVADIATPFPNLSPA